MKIKGSTLKWIAMATMLTDHLAALLLMPVFGVATMYFTDSVAIGGVTMGLNLMRQIGRLAFPIFCFLLVEGLVHTRSRARYLKNLLLFALFSEVPFDLAVSGCAIDLGSQSVAVTLILGFLACWGMDWLDNTQLARGLSLKKAALVGALMLAALLLHTDYDAFGVGAIVLLYMLRHSRAEQCLLGAIVFAIFEPAAALAFVPIYFYNGERGKQAKWLFYAFYPVHLLVLYFTRLYWIGW